MGWFSADEIVAPAVSSTTNSTNSSITAQTVALCTVAVVAVGYIAVKLLVKLHQQQTEHLEKCQQKEKAKEEKLDNEEEGKIEETEEEKDENIQEEIIQVIMVNKLDLGVAIRVVDKYDGNAASLQSWLDNVDVLCADDPLVPEENFMTFLKSRLVGAARGSLENTRTIEEAKNVLKAKFAIQLTPIAVEAKLRMLKQKNKTISEFGVEVEKLSTKLAAAWVSKGPPFTTEASAMPVVEPIAIHTVINGLKDQSAAYLVKSRNPKTLVGAISDALEVQPSSSSSEPVFWALGRYQNSFSNYNRDQGHRGGRGNNNNNNRGYHNSGNNNQHNNNHNNNYRNGYNGYNRGNRRNNYHNSGHQNQNYNNRNNNNNNDNGNRNNNQHRNANMAEKKPEEQPREEVNVGEFFRE
ncbi:rho GTPase-activating protein gacV-like [Topomyia yanbarensis]|uniref:rho GTPase-activating protein gacV-like n=1 Tax=Topomyia yanbarensis TaxID=2498891 RepID=UPI00273BA52F|nr:rho GTPase-activating protein gacV-like [Topomyia yanbarensis]